MDAHSLCKRRYRRCWHLLTNRWFTRRNS